MRQLNNMRQLSRIIQWKVPRRCGTAPATPPPSHRRREVVLLDVTEAAIFPGRRRRDGEAVVRGRENRRHFPKHRPVISNR